MVAKQFETLDLKVEDGIAVLTLNRPEKLNAFNAQMQGEMIAAFDATDADDAVKVVIVTGAGRGFCAGADLSGGAQTFDYDSKGDTVASGAKAAGVHRDGGGLLTLRIYESLKPIIAAVNGPAVGVGVTMQLPMDIRLASTEARFGFVFGRRGIHLEAASSWFLPRAVGLQTALEWCYTGKILGADEALAKGLVRSVHAPADLMPAAKALAREIADNVAPLSAVLTRQLLWRMAGAAHPMDAHRADSRGIQALGALADAREGVVSFLEKRPPAFSNSVSRELPDIWPDWVSPKFS